MQYGKTLKKIEANTRLERAALEVGPQRCIQRPTGTEQTRRAGGDSATKRSKRFSRFGKGRASLKSVRSYAPRDITPQNTPCGDDGHGDSGHDDENSADEGETDAPHSMQAPTPDFSTLAPHKVQYHLVLSGNGKLVQVPIDSEARLANGLLGNEEIGSVRPPAAVPAIEAIEAIESTEAVEPTLVAETAEATPPSEVVGPGHTTEMSALDSPPRALSLPAAAAAQPIPATEVVESTSDDDEEWDAEEYELPEDQVDFPGPEWPGLCPAVFGEPVDKPLVAIDVHLLTYIFVPDIELMRCRADGDAKLQFCVQMACINPDSQILEVSQPCSAQHDPPCHHITLEIDGGPISALSPLSQTVLISLRQEMSSTDSKTLPGGSNPALLLFPRCCCPKQHGHTKIENRTENDGDYYAVPTKLRACLDDRGFPVKPDPEDDSYAFVLLQKIMLQATTSVPPDIEWDSFVRFLALTHKYAQFVDDKPLKQARHWVNLFDLPSSFDANALTWLWVKWKLQMPEFQTLSSMAQRHTKVPICHWQDTSDNTFHLRLPEVIVGE